VLPLGPPKISSTKASEKQREECSVKDLWVSTKCGESDTTTGLGSCPTVGNMYDKLLPEGITGFLR
jgi:(2R)-sulfolactate sulfo-lyase subunit beta